MKHTLLLLAAITHGLLQAGAQNTGAPPSSPIHLEKAGDALRSEIIETPCSGSGFVPSADLHWKPILTHKMEESEPLEPHHEQIEKIREDILRMKQQRMVRTDATNVNGNPMSVTPTVGVHFNANLNDGWSPLDNNIAISNKGYVVSVANDTFEVTDSTGTQLYYNSLNTFINDNTIPNACDPVILYDQQADRFIFYCQEVTSTSNAPNHMLLFFSKTNNPATGGWNYFKLSGNPLNDGSMADYPKIGISNSDVFISSNLFASGSYNQSIVWQVQKSTGYSGGTLNSRLWSGIAGSPFTLLPVSEGQGRSYGPGIWMVATSSQGASTVDLYQITADITGSPTMNHYSVNTTAYTPAGDSQQKSSSATLKITDCRALSGFYLDGIIHFVLSSGDPSGNTAINYNRLVVGTKTNTSKLLSVNGTDYAYPAVASYTADGVTNDKSVMIGFAQSNSTIYPEICAVNCDNAMNFGPVTVVKNSDSYVGSSGSQRWGDYSGMCRRHNSPQACVWMAGSFGSTSNNWDAYVAQIYDASFATGVRPEAHLISEVRTYPNPVMDMFSVDFSVETDSKTTIAVYDMQGKIVRELFFGFCHEGENTFSFSKSNLSAGTYFLVIQTDSGKLYHEKVVVAN